jgi:hypothetical protein
MKHSDGIRAISTLPVQSAPSLPPDQSCSQWVPPEWERDVSANQPLNGRNKTDTGLLS